MGRWSLFALLIFGSISEARADTEAFDSVAAGRWEIVAYRDSQTRGFEYCATEQRFANGVSLIFMISPAGLAVGFHSPSWSLDESQTYPVRLEVDPNWKSEGNGTVATKNLLRIDLGDREAPFSALKNGTTLTVNAARGRFHFRLDGTSTALDALLNCTERHLASAPTNPFAAAESQSDPSPSTPQQQISDFALQFETYKELIEGITGQGATFVRDLDTYEFSKDGVNGVYFEADADGESIQTAVGVVNGYLAEKCNAQNVAGADPKIEYKNVEILRGFFMCHDEPKIYSNYVIMKSGERLMYFVAVSTEENSTALSSYNDTLAELLKITFSNE